MKKRITIIVVLVLSIALLATGVFAYFTSTASASGTIKSGTLALRIASVVPSAACPAYADVTQSSITLWDDTNLAPGDVFSGKICMVNTGSLPIPQVGFKWSGFSGALAENIFVTKLANSRTGDEIASYIAACGGGDGKMSLADLGNCNPGGEQEYWVGGVAVFLPVEAGVQWVEYTLQFNPEAGNEFQGLSFGYNLAITGYQNLKY
jgi:predicted ribosomally synthesized peptide with SipW-like signal peptide